MTCRARLHSYRSALAPLALLCLAACTDPPDLDGSIDPALRDADYPALVPVDQLLGPDGPQAEPNIEAAERLDARAAGLQARANQVQRSDPIDEETRRRLNSEIETD